MGFVDEEMDDETCWSEYEFYGGSGSDGGEVGSRREVIVGGSS